MKPYYEHAGITIYHGDCREILPQLSAIDCVVTDPPYGETNLQWDVPVSNWVAAIQAKSLWCFGSMRFWMRNGLEFELGGWFFAQELVWEKHNGSSFHADGFKRVHELICHWYREPWSEIYHEVPTTNDALARTVRRKARPPHWHGRIEKNTYKSYDGGERLMRSVLFAPSCHGEAVHPTQKPLEILRPLITYSCKPDGVVLDCFAGSGSTLVAASELSRKAIGIEIKEEYCEIAAKRLSQEVLNFQEVR